MEKNWSASLEHGEYVNNLGLLINDAMAAISRTAKGYYVNIVTPGKLENPDDYLTDGTSEIKWMWRVWGGTCVLCKLSGKAANSKGRFANSSLLSANKNGNLHIEAYFLLIKMGICI
ncbi:hypothetical protein [Cytobacillus oceanisediminis]|uniref:hypothetical protein n=1 Tax=Cytobacillus oceanisediminis TaxID=665099 RepID=UPI00207A9B00|nr:hypothetical protein [Cytobacillus oceanisediminis]USK44033.1 hypothetical protein LIT27_26240 [Cytobacillus oceanisediminis]